MRVVRLTNKTDRDIIVDDGSGEALLIPAGQTVTFPGEIAGADLRHFLAVGDIIIEDETG